MIQRNELNCCNCMITSRVRIDYEFISELFKLLLKKEHRQFCDPTQEVETGPIFICRTFNFVFWELASPRNHLFKLNSTFAAYTCTSQYHRVAKSRTLYQIFFNKCWQNHIRFSGCRFRIEMIMISAGKNIESLFKETQYY